MDVFSPNGLVSAYSIMVGLMMVGVWSALLLRGRVRDLETDRWGMIYHIVAESLTALVLVIAGIMLLAEMEWAAELELVALGMLLYAVLNSPGYYAQRGERGMVIMFGVLTLLTVLAITTIAFGAW